MAGTVQSIQVPQITVPMSAREIAKLRTLVEARIFELETDVEDFTNTLRLYRRVHGKLVDALYTPPFADEV